MSNDDGRKNLERKSLGPPGIGRQYRFKGSTTGRSPTETMLIQENERLRARVTELDRLLKDALAASQLSTTPVTRNVTPVTPVTPNAERQRRYRERKKGKSK